MVDERLSMRIEPLTKARLLALAAKLELPQAQIVRLAIRRLAEAEGVEDGRLPH